MKKLNLFKKVKNNLNVACVILLGFISGCGGGGGGTPVEPDPGPSVENKAEEQLILLDYLGNNVLLPGYIAFQQTSFDLKTNADSFCDGSSISQQELDDLRSAWREAMNDWQFIQMMRFGPISDSNYIFRIQFYPDNNDAVVNNVENLIAGSDPISESVIANSSVGSQGLPAIEYLIFKDNATAVDEFTDVQSAARRCDLLTSVAANLNTMSGEVVNRWEANGENFIGDFTGEGVSPDGDTTILDEMVSDVVNSMIEQAQIVHNNKLSSPFGDAAPGVPDNVESWRSLNSKQNVLVNFEAFDALYGGNNTGFSRYLNRVLEADILDQNMQQRINDLIAQTNLIDGNLVDAIDNQVQREILAELIEQANSFVVKLEGDFAEAMNATVGFNGNDGD